MLICGTNIPMIIALLTRTRISLGRPVPRLCESVDSLVAPRRKNVLIHHSMSRCAAIEKNFFTSEVRRAENRV